MHKTYIKNCSLVHRTSKYRSSREEMKARVVEKDFWTK